MHLSCLFSSPQLFSYFNAKPIRFLMSIICTSTLCLLLSVRCLSNPYPLTLLCPHDSVRTTCHPLNQVSDSLTFVPSCFCQAASHSLHLSNHCV